MKTTLNKIRKHSRCTEGWIKLLKHLGKTQADDEPLTMLTVLESNGLDYALWWLSAVDGHEKEIRLYAVWCARQVQHLMTDPRSIAALDVAERHANGEATDKDLSAARAAAWYVARVASRVAGWETARAEGWAGVWAAAWETARAAVWGTSRGASRDASLAASRAVAWEASEAAAWAAAWAASLDEAWCASRVAAWDAARAEGWDAEAWAETRSAQETELRRVLAEIEMRQK